MPYLRFLPLALFVHLKSPELHGIRTPRRLKLALPFIVKVGRDLEKNTQGQKRHRGPN